MYQKLCSDRQKYILLEEWKQIVFLSQGVEKQYSIGVHFFNVKIVIRYTYNINFILLTILRVWFRGIEYIHIMVQPSPTFIPELFSSCKSELCTHQTVTPHELLLPPAPGNHRSIFSPSF